jgi:ATP adenylyltransferase
MSDQPQRLWTPWRMAYLAGEDRRHVDGCLFCAKVAANDDAGEHIIHRGETAYVTLNRYPYNNGHLMVVPYAHVGSFEALEERAQAELMRLLNQCLATLRAELRPDGFNVGANLGAVAGAGVADHVHLHVVPRWSADTNFMPVISATRVIPEWLDETYARLRRAWPETTARE